jgi:flavodoxin I
MKKIGIFYGPERGSVEKVAKKLADKLGHHHVDLHPVDHATAAQVSQYENIIFGISTVGRETWDADYDRDDWDRFMPELDKIDYKDRIIAMYGLGDHIRYSQNFVDALGTLGRKFRQHKATLVGMVQVADYQFEDSEAVENGKFFGLPLDEDNEAEKTDERLDSWIAQIVPSFR